MTFFWLGAEIATLAGVATAGLDGTEAEATGLLGVSTSLDSAVATVLDGAEMLTLLVTAGFCAGVLVALWVAGLGAAAATVALVAGLVAEAGVLGTSLLPSLECTEVRPGVLCGICAENSSEQVIDYDEQAKV